MFLSLKTLINTVNTTQLTSKTNVNCELQRKHFKSGKTTKMLEAHTLEGGVVSAL